MTPQQYCLRWKHHHSNVQSMFAQLLETERFCDVTLYCSPNFATQVTGKDTVEPQNIRGVSLRAHRVVLAACSELLGALLGAHEAHGEPVLVIDGAEPKHLKALLDYMYTGEMNVHHSQLASLLKTAEELRIKGLTDLRWNNKDEPPDSETAKIDVMSSGVVATPTSSPVEKQTDKLTEKQEKTPSPLPILPKLETSKQISPKPETPKLNSPKQVSPKISSPKQVSPKQVSPKQISPKLGSPRGGSSSQEAPRTPEAADLRSLKTESEVGDDKALDKFNVNGGPPPLIKLTTKERISPIKRENSEIDSPSPKRQRLASATEHMDEDSMSASRGDKDEWQHGNLNITAERVVGWGGGSEESSREPSEEDWADAPADIGSFLHTRLRVDGDNSADEETNDSTAGPPSRSTVASSSSSAKEIRMDFSTQLSLPKRPKSDPTDPRFTDVVKLSDYLQHGRRPQFWEEPYVRRVMESVRLKELEMKQAAEILGVSYGTLYGRYRDVYGCINRPYRAVRDFWQAKGPSEVLERLQRGDMTLDAAAHALGVTINTLAAHVADFGHAAAADFEPIPIEVDPSLKSRMRTYSGQQQPPGKQPPRKPFPSSANDKPLVKKLMVGSGSDEELQIPATVISSCDSKLISSNPPSCGKWPTIRVASIDSLRATEPVISPVPAPPPPVAALPPAPTLSPASPSQLMRTRPDLTIVAARRPDPKRDEDDT
ncbi:protein tramtrack, alpha isoform isoform X1 [Bombyx mandarina]|uniref:Protein tramtrack, alpha isoform isoform X1 n=1 Tax=Bombyx mandarina TaxID=7092 RepID=A0A6J2K0H4_BOMMA|nr:protein tramtrack, alpha isoform isoform X1 [Bombyx mandarina]XP_028035728.1 protein tramtrack, alpha isoform isoform X1 [Bombyx mandarina]XP_028035729.1 protein tramtrack, alpha isoform isoform X1 [Bombyx mandarina]